MNKEKENRLTSMYVALGSHAVLALIFFLMVAWSEPDPPIPEYGIEFNLGEQLISSSTEDDKPVEAEEISTEEEMIQEEVEEVEESEEVSETESDFDESEDSSEEAVESPEEVSEEVAETEDVYSAHVVEKQQKEVEKTEKEVQEEEVEKSASSKTEETVKEVEQASQQPAEPAIDQRAIYKKSDSGTGTGNKGASLDLSGWMWDIRPKPDDRSDENGYIIFEIKVDDEGEIVAIKTLEKTVSPVVEQVYTESVRELTFSRISNNSSSAPISTGKVTFIIQSK